MPIKVSELREAVELLIALAQAYIAAVEGGEKGKDEIIANYRRNDERRRKS